MALHPLCPVDDLPKNEGRAFVVAGQPIAVFRLDDGGVYAIDDICTHGQAFLSEGYVEDGMVECPLHAGRFDIRSGCPKSDPVHIAVASYPVSVVNGVAYVLIPEKD